MSEIVVDVIDNGPMGAELRTWHPHPNGCPGEGGWKNLPTGEKFTRVKGELAERLLRVAKQAPGGTITLIMEGDQVVNTYI